MAVPLEELGDLWPVFRRCRLLISNGGVLTTLTHRHGAFSREEVDNLLNLSGFAPCAERQVDTIAEVDAIAYTKPREALSCTVVVPCRNEVGNIDRLVERTPDIGVHAELIFVDGASTDGTQDRIKAQMGQHPERNIGLIHQTGGGGKAAAVFMGFDHAEGDIVVILDADMTVAPEDLPRFYDVIAEGSTDFANGSRFLYPMERGAMRATNNVGNRVFCAYLSWLIGARITDTLCGTKAMRKRDWERIREARPLFGGHDPWGDFDLLLGAAYCGLRISDVPIVYGARTAGESKMHAFSHGAELAKTCLAGFTVLKMQRQLRFLQR